MSFVSVLHRLLRPSDATGRPRRPRPRKAAPRSSFRPRLEALEARTLPSTVPFVVTSLADSGAGTLRYAISTADADSDTSHDYIINFDVTGGINLTSGLPDLAKNITIQGPGAGSLAVRRDTGDLFRIFAVPAGQTVNISDLTIANGDTDDSGGGIFNGGTLSLTNCTLTNNTGANGGGIFNDLNGTATLTNCTLTNNSATFGAGGGIENFSGTATVTNCTLVNNSAGNGGGIGNDSGTATVAGCTFTNNSASGHGGGIYNATPEGPATVLVTNCAMDGNGSDEGGGIYNVGTATVTNCTLTNNAAVLDGGGIFGRVPGKLTVTDCTLTSNSAGFGGGIINDSGTATVTNCTLTSNTAVVEGGGILNATDSTLTVNNTIVAANQSLFGNDLRGTVDPSSSFNLIGDGTFLKGISSGMQGNQVGTTANPVNPLLGALRNNGGVTQTLALLPGSPAIDAGGNALAVDANGVPLTTDQRGVARIVNGTVDIGAFESRPFTIAITSGGVQSTTVNTGFLNPLYVTVTSAYGDPVRGGVVTFTAPTNGASAIFPASGGGATTATIDPVGQAAVAATADTTAGGYAVRASSRGASFPAGFSLTNTPGAARSFAVSGFPSPTIAGVAHTIIVVAKDQYGNTATGYGGVVSITSSDPQATLPAYGLLTNGVGLFSVTLKTAGTQTITATDAMTADLTGGQSGITVSPSTAVAFLITAPATVAHGAAFTVTVTAVDAYGNVAAGYRGTIKFSSSDDNAVLPDKYAFSAADGGVHAFTGLKLRRKGTQTITVFDAAHKTLLGSFSIDVT